MQRSELARRQGARMTAALPPICVNLETVKSNAFSKHDNRHTIENCGVHLGTGLGRKPLSNPVRDQHRSDKRDFIDGRTQLDCPTSTYVSGYKLRSHDDQASRRCVSADGAHTTHSEAHHDLVRGQSASAKETLHRFPRKYFLPKDLEGVRPSLSSTWWFNQERLLQERGRGSPGQAEEDKREHGKSHRNTTLGVLAVTQQPFLKPNQWKY